MKRLFSSLSSVLRHCSGTAVLCLGVGLPLAGAGAGSGYREIATFEEGKVATLFINVEYKPDGSRSIDVRFNRSPLGSTVFFHREQWQIFAAQLAQAKGAPDGVEQKFPDLPTPGGSLLRMSFVRHGGEVDLTLIDWPTKGDSYPPVPFHLAPPDFDSLLKAMVNAAKAEVIVSATSPADFARFRAELGTRFPPEQLQEFDTAIEELQLDAVYRGKSPGINDRTAMLAGINRKIFPDVVLLGWRARQARVIREIIETRRLIDQDTAEAAKTAAAGTPEALTTRLAREKDALAQLRHDRDDATHRLAELDRVIGRTE